MSHIKYKTEIALDNSWWLRYTSKSIKSFNRKVSLFCKFECLFIGKRIGLEFGTLEKSNMYHFFIALGMILKKIKSLSTDHRTLFSIFYLFALSGYHFINNKDAQYWFQMIIPALMIKSLLLHRNLFLTVKILSN